MLFTVSGLKFLIEKNSLFVIEKKHFSTRTIKCVLLPFHSGKNVLNQKSELQRALEKQREAASRREAERIREESYKDDPRTALQRAIEQRARHIQLTVIRSSINNSIMKIICVSLYKYSKISNQIYGNF